ncbi:MAG: hypothetical protein AAGH82_10290 [Pseudomonadota bacterium]
MFVNSLCVTPFAAAAVRRPSAGCTHTYGAGLSRIYCYASEIVFVGLADSLSAAYVNVVPWGMRFVVSL